MNILLIGEPGSGKGTQAEMVADKLGLTHFSTGKLFRELKDGREIREIMSEGDLVPDNKVVELAEKYLTENNLYNDLILDGSPRSLYQYLKFKEFFKNHGTNIDAGIYLRISENEAIKRLTARRENKNTGEIYNLLTNPPGPNVHQEDLIQRDDDREEAVKERLKVQKVPEDLLNEMKKDGILIQIDGERPIDVIFEDIIARLKENQ